MSQDRGSDPEARHDAAFPDHEGELRPERLGAPLRPERLGLLARELPGWRVDGGRLLTRTFRWPDRAAAVAFVGLAAVTGEALAAAPEIRLAGTRVDVRLAARGEALTEGQVAAAKALGGGAGVAVR
jgi:pterin-4a-carbinolamine dehydratase